MTEDDRMMMRIFLNNFFDSTVDVGESFYEDYGYIEGQYSIARLVEIMSEKFNISSKVVEAVREKEK